jgi:Icc-related predicted phosphoesterase
MKLIFIGDVHSNIAHLANLITNNPDVDAFFQVGDFGLYHTTQSAKQDKQAMKHTPKLIKEVVSSIQQNTLQKFIKPIYFIKGNHDDYDGLTSQTLQDANIHFINQGSIISKWGIHIGCLGGIYSSIRSYWDGTKFQGRENRFFTKNEIDSLLVKAQQTPLDIIITHQACYGVLPTKHRNDEGSKDLMPLIRTIKPKLYFHGHHHKNYETTIDNTHVVGLGNFGKNSKSFKTVIINNGRVRLSS